MDKITTVNQLVHQLSISSKEELGSICNKIQIPKEEFYPFCTWSEKRYTRNCIVRTDDYELLVLCWEEGQKSAIHSHNDQECWLYTIDGKFKEDRYELGVNGKLHRVKEDNLNENESSYMTDHMGFHDIQNINNNRSVSLHLYAKPLDQCNVFNNSTNSFELKDLNYDTIDGVTTAQYQI